MDEKMSGRINQDRRRFWRSAAKTIAAAELAMIGPAEAQSHRGAASDVPVTEPGSGRSFGSLKQIDAGVLRIGYVEAEPADGRAVNLLHSWLYDIFSYVEVVLLLASAGFRVIVPYLRGYGPTRFLSRGAFRNGQPAALAVDVVALMDASGSRKQRSLVSIGRRGRLGLADGERQYDDLEKQLAVLPLISVPTITLEGDANGTPHPDAAAYIRKFSGRYEHRLITGGIGHNLPQETPQAFADAMVDTDRL
jgi:pimeloyl-ACP methyl ester carboxylesterase